jgi:SNF2 family DNA or RNA helicase
MKFTPYEYQQYCIDRIINMPVPGPGLGLFIDMGLGKSVITLTAILELRFCMFDVKKVLIIAPKKVAESTWTAEAEKWDHLHGLRISKVLGSAKKRIEALCAVADVYVINRENTQWLVDRYRNDWPFDMVVLDESSSFKNHQSKRFKALTWVRNKITRLVELTGTPAPNGLMDLWAQLFLLDGGERLGKRIGGYRQRYFNPDQRNGYQIFSYKPKKETDEAIHNKISDICISMAAEDYLELPDLVYQDIPVELSPKAQKAYDKLERDMLLDIEDDEITATTAAVLGNKLLQLGNGAVYDQSRKVVEVHDCKLEAFLETVEMLNGQHALVFYNFKHDRDRILRALKAKMPRLRVRMYRGPEDGEAWNAGNVDLLLAHPASTAYGLNLQYGGYHIIWFGLTWSLELYQQANKRLHRQGQKRTVFVHNLCVRDSMDMDVLDALRGKLATQEALLDAIKVRIKRLRQEGA